LKTKGTSKGVPFLFFVIFKNMTTKEKKQKNREKMAKATRKLNQKKGLDRKYIYGYLLLVGVNFIYFLPILIGLEIPYSDWMDRMWLPSWI